MSSESFQFSFAQACSELDIDVSALGEHGALLVGGTQVYVDHAEPSDMCRIVVDLGAVPQERAADLFQVMLEANCVDAADILPVFSLHPLTGRALLTLFVPMSGLDSQRHDLALLLSERVPDLIEGWLQMATQGAPEPPDGTDAAEASKQPAMLERVALVSRRA